MKTWMFALLGLLLFTAAGCHIDRATREAWAAEDFRKERQINNLQYRIEELEDDLASAKRQADSRRDEDFGGSRGRKKAANGSIPVESPETELGTPSRQKGDDILKPGGSRSIDVPDVPEAIRGPAKATGTSLEGRAAENGFSVPSGHITEDVLNQLPRLRPSGDSRRVTSIVLDHTLTGGIAPNNGSGDIGVLAVIEPRDASGRLVDAPAVVSVLAMDPAVKNVADARVGRWDFTAGETAARFRRAGSGGAMFLGMKWPSEPPKRRNLQLFVRYTTADGRTLEANQPIEIALPGDKTARWAPAERAVEEVRDERVIRDERVADRSPLSEPRRLPSWSGMRNSEESSSRTVEPAKFDRPVWSPERR